MDYIEATVRTTTEGAELVSDILISTGAKGTLVEDREDIHALDQTPGMWDLVDESVLANMDVDVLVRAYFRADGPVAERLAEVEQRLALLWQNAGEMDFGQLTLATETVHEEDWAETWKQYYKPFKPGKRLVVKPSWEPYEATADELVVEVDPGMAFGTGTHETTMMCLAALEEVITPGMRVIDIGTGTGILSIAAVRLGASEVLAIDLDPDAVNVARENVRKNAVDTRVRVVAGDLLKQQEERAELVVANIIADAILALSGPVRGHLERGGKFLSSGIIRDRAGEVQEALQAQGYRVLRRFERGEWVCFLAEMEAAL